MIQIKSDSGNHYYCTCRQDFSEFIFTLEIRGILICNVIMFLVSFLDVIHLIFLT